MKTSKPISREAVAAFFKYRVTPVQKKSKTHLLTIGVLLAIVSLVVLVASTEEIRAGAVLFLGAGVLLMIFQIGNLFHDWKATREHRKRSNELERLASETRKVQHEDIRKAFVRIYTRAQVDRQEMRIFEEQYQLSAEKDVFAEESMDDVLGDLSNKSLRLFTRGDLSNINHRSIRWVNQRTTEQFFNPIRIVTMSLTGSQMILCDVQIDSIDGDLKEDISRVSLPQVVSVGYSSNRSRLKLPNEEVLSIATDLHFTKDELKEIKDGFKHDTDHDWVLEEMTSDLNISRTDGNLIRVPMRVARVFGKHLAALDQETSLTTDEIQIDKIVNELNRLVASDRTFTPASNET